jgi:diguanylate cyclase (GGDEF)-like protein/PAS domain S-box-containing protein
VDRELLDAFLEHIPDNVFFKDRDSRFVRISKSMASYFGLKDPRQAVGKTDADIFSSEHADQALLDEKEIIRTGQPMLEKEEKETWPDGHETWVLTTKVPLNNRHGQIVGTMGIAHDITDRKQAEMRVRYLALHDSLTGLPNRTLLEDRLSQAIALASRHQKQVAILMLDLNRFKNVNDMFGHYVGDRLLEAASVRLKACLRESDTVARVGSDEFVIVLQAITSTEDVDRVTEKILAAVSERFQIEEHEVQISGSVGISRFPEDGEHPAILLQCADAAMYEAKRRGRGTHCLFSPALTEGTRQQQKLEDDLQHACERDEFVLHYQPIVAADSGQITGVEALLRWRHPERGLISPNQFIPQLEELGLMVGVGQWVLRAACRQNVTWQQAGYPPIRVAVNVSSQQLYRGNIVDTVRSVLHETGLEPKWLELELTESQTLDDSEATIKILQNLKRIGVSLSLDDFGTGWSSLSYLRRFPIDRIKIDRSFIRDLLSQPTAEAVVKSILGLSRNLGLACIAEGVETPKQRDYLQRNMHGELQGYLFSRPLTPTDCTALLRSVTHLSKDVFARTSR